MSKTKFNPTVHTVQYFNELNQQYNNNKTLMANSLGISRASLNRWIQKSTGDAPKIINTTTDNMAFITPYKYYNPSPSTYHTPHRIIDKNYLFTFGRFKKALNKHIDSEAYDFFIGKLSKNGYNKLDDPKVRWRAPLERIFAFLNEYIDDFER